jgi:hypothetical protein
MSLIATRMQDWRIRNPRLDKNMTRPQEYGALDFFVQQTNSPNSILSPELRQRALGSMGNTIKLPVIDFDGDVSVSNVRTCLINDAENTSHLYQVIWSTLAVGFTMVPSLYMNNDVDYDWDFSRKLEKISRALANALDQGAIAALEAHKTQVFQDLLVYQQSGNSVQVPWNARNEILADMNTIMRANEYPGQIHVIGNAGVDSMIRKMAEHGLYNDENKQLEYAGKIIHFTNNLVNEASMFGSMFVVEDGNVGVLTRVDREAFRRARYAGHEWDIVTMPFIDLPVGAHYYTSVGDFSNITGDASADMTCVGKEFFGFSLDVAFLVAYNTDETTIANPIVKAEIASPATANPFASPVFVTNDQDNPVITDSI